MGWSERVRREDIGAFEARARADGNPGYRVFDRPDSAIASAATAIDRLAPNPVRERRRDRDPPDRAAREQRHRPRRQRDVGARGRAAILPAVETGRPAATAGFRLTQQSDNDRQMGVVVYQAIYDHEVTTPPIGATAFRGVVFVSLAMDAQLATLVGKVPAYLDLCVIDADHLATRRRVAGRAGCDAAPTGLVHERPYAFRRPAVGPAGDGAAQDVPEALDRGATSSPPPGCSRRRCSAPRS
jgi:hypothetical protein